MQSAIKISTIARARQWLVLPWFLLFVLVGCNTTKRSPERQGTPPGLEGQVVGNGGDFLEALFLQGKEQAAQLVEQLREDDLARVPSGTLTSDELGKLLSLRKRIADDLRTANHRWAEALPTEKCPPEPTCACAPSDTSPGVFLSYRNCRAISRIREAGSILFHESLHRVLKSSEPEARRMTAGAYRIWFAWGHSEEAHWKNMSLPVGALYGSGQSTWNGRELVTWGSDAVGFYDPGRDAWTTEFTVNKVEDFLSHDEEKPFPGKGFYASRGAWVGERLVVPTACRAQFQPTGAGLVYRRGSYDWQAVTASGAPASRELATLVPTANALFLWGGFRCPRYRKPPPGAIAPPMRRRKGFTVDTSVGIPPEVLPELLNDADPDYEFHEFRDGGLYYPQSNRWVPIPEENAPPHTAPGVLAGNRVLVWGNGGGARFDLETLRWEPIETDGAPSLRASPILAWTGNSLLVYGGWRGDEFQATGGIYRPENGIWAPMASLNAPVPPLPDRRYPMVGAWTGTFLVVKMEHLHYYDPRKNLWVEPENSFSPFPFFSDLYWAGAELLLWHEGHGYRFFP